MTQNENDAHTATAGGGGERVRHVKPGTGDTGETVEAWKRVARGAGVCMTCAITPPEPIGCTDCLNTGWDGGCPDGFVPETGALADIAAERRRQIEAEGWTPEHDDAHSKCEMAVAAACYALAPSPVRIEREWVYASKPANWPWDRSGWKPNFYRRNLVKAGALIVAEIERWDRAAPATTAETRDPADREGGR